MSQVSVGTTWNCVINIFEVLIVEFKNTYWVKNVQEIDKKLGIWILCIPVKVCVRGK